MMNVPTLLKSLGIAGVLSLVAVAPELTAAPSTRVYESSAASPERKLFADNKSKGKGVREKHIVREGRTTRGDQRNIDFDAVDIAGERKTPLGTLVNNNKLDKNYDFVKIRLRWHPEMVQSASSLESGGSR